MNRGAVISDCGKYRYSLTRAWGFGQGRCCFIMLNPSTADASIDDPTIRRCIGFAQGWGYQMLEVVNLYAWRATDPRELDVVMDPVGPENDEHLVSGFLVSDLAVAAWGNYGGARAQRVRELLRKRGDGSMLHHLGLTHKDEPRHPLYLRKDTQPTVWL